MKNDFASAAKGMDKEFIFKGYRYRLETDVDADGEVKAIRLDSETLPPVLRVSLEKESEMMSRGLQLGDTLDSLIEQFSLNPGNLIYPLVIMNNGKPLSDVANNVWVVAMRVLKREYHPESAMAPQKPKTQHKFQALNGGLA